MSALSITLMLVLAIVVIAELDLFPVKHSINRLIYMLTAERRVYDEAGILSQYDRKEFEEYLHWIFAESDVDIRLVFLKNTGRKTIEEVAIEKVQAQGGEIPFLGTVWGHKIMYNYYIIKSPNYLILLKR